MLWRSLDIVDISKPIGDKLHTPWTRIRHIEMVSAFLGWELGTGSLRDGAAEAGHLPSKLAVSRGPFQNVGLRLLA